MGRIVTVTSWPGQTNPTITVNGFGFAFTIGQQLTITDAVYQQLLLQRDNFGVIFTDGGAAADPPQSAEINADVPIP